MEPAVATSPGEPLAGPCPSDGSAPVAPDDPAEGEPWDDAGLPDGLLDEEPDWELEDEELEEELELDDELELELELLLELELGLLGLDLLELELGLDGLEGGVGMGADTLGVEGGGVEADWLAQPPASSRASAAPAAAIPRAARGR